MKGIRGILSARIDEEVWRVDLARVVDPRKEGRRVASSPKTVINELELGKDPDE